MKKILFFNTSNCGGAERMTILYAKIVHKFGMPCKIFIVAKKHEKIPILDFIPSYIDTEIIKIRYRYLFFYLFKAIRKEHGKVIFCSIPIILQLLALIKKLHLARFYLIARCFNMPERLSNESFRALKSLKQADMIVSQTDEMTNAIIKSFYLESQKVVTINNPIDLELINERIKEPFYYDRHYLNYIAVGRICSQKNYQMLIRAFNKLHKQKSNVRLYIVGNIYEKEYFEQLKSLVEEFDLQKNVFWEGFQPNPYKYMYHADAFVLSSDFEGLPNVLLESMYLNIPVVATRCIPFIQKVIKEGVNGYSVNVGDDDAFSFAMIKAPYIKIEKKKKYHVEDSENKIVNLFRDYINR